MTTAGIHGQLLEINVVGCRNLKDKEWLTRQDPYVIIDYANTKFRTKTDTDGGKNPSFNEKFTLALIEGLRELNVQVWNSNTLTFDDFIGSGRIQLEKALSTGYDDSGWPITSKSGKYGGEVRLILHYAHARNQKAHIPASPGYYAATPAGAPYAEYYSPPQYPAAPYSGYPPAHAPTAYPPAAYPPVGYPPQGSSSNYPPQSAAPYPPPGAPYPPSAQFPPAPGYRPPPGAYPPYPGGPPGYPSW